MVVTATGLVIHIAAIMAVVAACRLKILLEYLELFRGEYFLDVIYKFLSLLFHRFFALFGGGTVSLGTILTGCAILTQGVDGGLLFLSEFDAVEEVSALVAVVFVLGCLAALCVATAL